VNQELKELMRQADYAAPELAKRAQVLSELIIKHNIQILINNGYDDAAKCLHDVHYGIEDSV